MDAMVGNAADKEQVKEARQKELRGRELELNDMKNVLSTPYGRRFVWRILGHCKVFESIYHGSSLIHYNSGKQDVGHYLLSEISDADQNALFKMMQEMKGK